MAVEPTKTEHDRLAVLRIPDFRRYLIGGAFAASGAQMTGITAGWELYDRTRMPISLGLLGHMGALPVILLALPAGTVADRFNRKGICVGAELLAALCLASLSVVSRFHTEIPFSLPLFYVLFLMLATCSAFLGPALGALMANIVGNDLLADATKWSSIRWQLASTLGPVIGGFLLHKYSPALIYSLEGKYPAACGALGEHQRCFPCVRVKRLHIVFEECALLTKSVHSALKYSAARGGDSLFNRLNWATDFLCPPCWYFA